MADGKLVTRYFEILPPFLAMTQQEKTKFWQNANLDDEKTTVSSFAKYADDKIDELFAQEEVQNSKWSFKNAAMKQNWITDITCLLILVMNFVLLFGLEVNEGKILDNPSLFGMSFRATNGVLYAIAVVILVLFLYTAAIQGGIVYLLYKVKIEKESCNRTQPLGPSQQMLRKSGKLLKILRSRNILWIAACLFFVLIGLIFDFFWFSFTLIYLAPFSPNIKEILMAVWKPKSRILSTVVLSFTVLYWFGMIAYVYFGSDFNGAIPGSNMTLRRSLLVIIDSWYKEGLGAFLAEQGQPGISQDSEEFKFKGERVLFDFLFFFMVPTLLLNILAGIIIDNFVERRSHNDSIIARQNDMCFICGKKANKIRDFSNHTKYEHNLWDYMYYVGYLRAMKSSELHDYRDIHVLDCIEKRTLYWFPAYRDFVRDKLAKSENRDKYLSSKPDQEDEMGSFPNPAKLKSDISMSLRRETSTFKTGIDKSLNSLGTNLGEKISLQEAAFEEKLNIQVNEIKRAVNMKMKDMKEKVEDQASELKDLKEDFKAVKDTLSLILEEMKKKNSSDLP